MADHSRRGIDRRTIVLGVGAVGAATLVAACGGDDSGAANGGDAGSAAPPTSSTGQPSTPPDTPPQATDEPGDTPSQADPASLVATADVPVGGGVIVDDVVVVQPSAGQFVAFSSTRTHQGCTVTGVNDGLIECPCHGSRFAVADGSVRHGPAESPLPEVPIVVDGTQVRRA